MTGREGNGRSRSEEKGKRKKAVKGVSSPEEPSRRNGIGTKKRRRGRAIVLGSGEKEIIKV